MKKKLFKRISLVLLILFVILLLASMLIVGLFEDRIGNKILTEVNKQLTSELRVEDFDMTVLSSFPNIATNLRGVELDDSGEGILLEAKKISFRFGLFSLLGSSLKVKSVLVSDGAINVQLNKNGKPNYDIFKSSDEGSEAKSTSSLSLKSALLEEMEVIFSNEKEKQEVMANVEEATFSGNFSSKRFSLDSEAKIDCRFIEMDGKRFLAGKQLGYNVDVLVDLKNGLYEIKNADFQLESNIFKINGQVEQLAELTNYDLVFSNDAGNLESIIELLPDEYFEEYQGLKSKGDFVLEGAISGEASKGKNPKIDINLQLENGKITGPQIDGAFKDVSFLVTFSNGRKQDNSTSVFEIKRLKGYFNNELAELKLKVRNLDNPYVDFLMDGVLPLNTVYGMFGNPKISGGDGEIEIKELSVKGYHKDMIRTSRISRVEASGTLEFDDASLTINGEKLILDRGRLMLEDNILNIEDLKLEGAGNEIQFNGNAFNVIPVLFADSLNSKNAELEFQANLHAQTMDIDRLLTFASIGGENPENVLADSLKVEQVLKGERISNFLKGTFDAIIDEFNYGKVEGQAFNGKLRFNNNELDINGKTNAMDGSFDLKSKMYFEDRPRLEAQLVCKEIDVNKFFKQTEDFGQEVLQSKHVSGTLNAKIAIYAFWDEAGAFEEKKLRVLAGVGIENGELKDFEMLEDFSSYVNVKDLRHIKFVNIQNFLEIRNRRLHLPVMFIQSNALNLMINGEHSFDHEIKYNIKVNAGQVLSNNFKNHDPNLNPIKARKKGWFNLYYSILGTLEDYNIKSAKKRVKSDFELSDKRRRDVQYELEQIFGPIEVALEPTEWEDIPEYDEGDTGEDEYIDWEDEEGEELIEWDDDGK